VGISEKTLKKKESAIPANTAGTAVHERLSQGNGINAVRKAALPEVTEAAIKGETEITELESLGISKKKGE